MARMTPEEKEARRLERERRERQEAENLAMAVAEQKRVLLEFQKTVPGMLIKMLEDIREIPGVFFSDVVELTWKPFGFKFANEEVNLMSADWEISYMGSVIEMAKLEAAERIDREIRRRALINSLTPEQKELLNVR